MSSTDSKIVPFQFKAGIYRDSTRHTTGGFWYDANRVRFHHGKPENIRGWQKKISSTFEGVGRAITSWASLSGRLYAAVGTDQLLYVLDGGAMYDITPITTTMTAYAAGSDYIFSSTGKSKLIVDWNAQTPDLSTIGLTQNTFVIVSCNTASVGGLSFSGKWRTSIPANLSAGRYFALVIGSAAGSNAAVSTSASFAFLLNAGSQTAVEDLGYGTFTWNTPRQTNLGYGVPASVGTGFSVLPRNWSLTNWGEDLVACPRDGRIYIWDEGGGTGNRATVITSCPTKNTVVRVTPLSRYMVAFGTNTLTSVFDPLLVRWSDQEDYNQWVPASGNTSGEQQVGDGSKIVGAVNSRSQTLIWTDNALHGMNYVGTPFIFSFQQLGTNCGLVGPNAAVEADGRAFWMSNKNFFVYDGQLRILPTPISDYIFDNINTSYTDKVFAGFNKEFTEVTWLYPDMTSNECNRYVTYNPGEDWWSYGAAKWTTWEDKKLFSNILTTGNDSYLYDNEPVNVYTGDGEAIESYVQSGDFDLDAGTFGNNIVFIDRIIPDMNFSSVSGDAYFTINFKRYPQAATETTKGPFLVSAATPKINLRGRGRVANYKVSRGPTANSGWRIGGFTADMLADGEQ